jgi:hypothetical protein
VSFVGERHDDRLALEFRSKPDLHPMNERILESFALLPERAGGPAP